MAPANALPKNTKSTQSRIPAPQRERIVKKFIAGQGIRQISREENRSRGTVSRIVRSTDVQRYVSDLRASYYGLGGQALEAVQRALRRSSDGKIAYQLLADIGVVPSPEERQQAAVVGEIADTKEEHQHRFWMARLIEATIERAAIFETTTGFEEDLEKMGARINHTTAKLEAIDSKSAGARAVRNGKRTTR